MKHLSILLFLFLFAMIATPCHPIEAAKSQDNFQYIIKKEEKPLPPIKIYVADRQDLIITLFNNLDSKPLCYHLYELPKQKNRKKVDLKQKQQNLGKEIEHKHFQPGVGNAKRIQVTPGKYRFEVSCPADCHYEVRIKVLKRNQKEDLYHMNK